MFLSYLLTEITNNEPEFIDYVFVYWMLELFEKEENRVRKNIKDILKTAQKQNYELEMKYTEKNLEEIGVADKMHPIQLNYNEYNSKRMNRLIDKQMNKFSKEVKNQILNGLNTADVNGVKELFETTLKNKKNAVAQQRQSYKNNMAQKNEQIENLNKSISQALSKVVSVAQKIDMVLKEDGSSNNNN